MSPCSAYRSLAISLVIVAAVIEPPASGFAIPRTANITDETDLTGEESSILSVRHEQKRPNDINGNDNGKGDSKEKFSFEAKPNSKEVSTDRLINRVTEFTTGTVTYLDDFNRKFTNSKNNNDFRNTRYDEVDSHSNAPAEQIQHTIGFTTLRNNFHSHTLPSITTAQSETASTHVQNNYSNIENNWETAQTLERTSTTKDIASSSDATALHEISTPTSTSPKLRTFTLANDLTAITLSVDELNSLRDLASSITETDAVENSGVTSTYLSSPTRPTVPTKRPETNTASAESKNIQEEIITHYYTHPTGYTKHENANVMSTAETVNIVPTQPLWKKYTGIERNRVTTDTSIATEADLNKPEIPETTVNYEQSFNPNAFEKFTTTRIDKITDYVTVNDELLTTTTGYSNFNGEDYTPYEFTTPKTPSKPYKISVSSKMAGFLDYSKASTPNVDPVQISEPTKEESEVILTTLYETTTVDTTTPETKTTKATESQQQLVEDAINEELLKEELMNDNEDAKRYRGDRPGIPDLKQVKPLAEDVTNINNLASNQTEDSLVVQPINHEKIKNAILYAVSPKYKPMKKIDIQPPKQFVRDPDDNSWRHVSISSLGIVFKPKNSSKSYTQVLKNKTEVELSNLTDRDDKGGVPDLRQRLEKIAEIRKSKKKKINKYGDTVYVDYEEGNISLEIAGLKKRNNTVKLSFMDPIFTTTPLTPELQTESVKNNEPLEEKNATTTEIDIFKRFELDALTTDKPKKYYNPAEYYDTTDEYDVDYLNMSRIDLKKYTLPSTKVTTTPTTLQTPPSIYVPERKPTIQYFPPTTKKVKVNVNDYDDSFKKKINLYAVEALPKDLRKALSPAPFATMATPPPPTENIEEIKSTPSGFQSNEFNKNVYFTDSPGVIEPHNPFTNEPDFNRGSYVIKHYKDFLNVAAKDDDYRNEYMTYTESPVKGITINELAKESGIKIAEDEYDYEQQFRKDLLNRFVANFNQNNERFKVDFPILFNNSVIHRKVDERGKTLAESTAFMKRLYDTATAKPNPYVLSKPCDPNCDKITVELSPAYELHYYVPEQEEKEEAEPVTVGYHQYRS